MRLLGGAVAFRCATRSWGQIDAPCKFPQSCGPKLYEHPFCSPLQRSQLDTRRGVGRTNHRAAISLSEVPHERILYGVEPVRTRIPETGDAENSVFVAHHEPHDGVS
jgi:hypothetical protein